MINFSIKKVLIMKIIFLFIFIGNCFCELNLNISKQNINNRVNNKTNNTNFSNYEKIHKKNLILGVIMWYSLEIILPFFNSLLQAKIKNYETVIFVKNVSQNLINYLKSIGVIIYNINNDYKNIPITKFRWKIYFDFLNKKKSEYELIFIADIRDTFFQRDIFKCYENRKSFIGISIEDGTLNQGINKKWVKDFAGEEKQNTIKNERIICFGSIWGTLDKILEFSNIFWEKLKSNTNSTDQGIGNYLFYYEKIFEDCVVKSDNYGPVMTIGRTQRENIILDLNNNVLNFGGEIAAVIHQYDRKRDIAIKIKKKFLYNNFTRVIDCKNQKNLLNKYSNNNKLNKINQLHSNKELAKYINILL